MVNIQSLKPRPRFPPHFRRTSNNLKCHIKLENTCVELDVSLNECFSGKEQRENRRNESFLCLRSIEICSEVHGRVDEPVNPLK